MPILTGTQEDSATDEKLKQANINLSAAYTKYHSNEIQFNQLNLNKKLLEKLKTDFDKLINTFAENSSLFSRVAIFWGKLAAWQKVVLGTVLIAPMFIAALMLHLIPLLVVSLSVLFMFTVSCFFLNNHYKHCEKDKEKLRQGFLSFATIISEVITSLNKLHSQLWLEIEKIHQERQILSDQLIKLHKEMNGMKEQVISLSKAKEELHTTQNQLECLVEELSLRVQEQANLLEQYSLKLEQITLSTELRQAELSLQIAQLNQTNETLELELKKAKQVTNILQGSLQVLSGTIITDKEQRTYFQQRLQEFVTNEELTLAHFAHSLLETGNKLCKVQMDFERLNEDHSSLLNQQEIQIERLEQVVSERINIASTLNNVGLFPNPKPERLSLEKNTTYSISSSANS
ncbi:hypothetical protein ACQUW5_13250 [Legionella sp. CNM-1927-20]|uniref:hypothetical protein n=1 Tax=Legionella sp. CNM-1927-20 TaxID=3422221 RepID=UPI00403AE559